MEGWDRPASDTIDYFDSESGQWSSAKLPRPHGRPAAVSMGSLALFDSGYNELETSRIIDMYDTATGEWSTGKFTRVNTGRGFPETTVAATAVGAKAIFLNSCCPQANLDIYDGADGRWSTGNGPDLWLHKPVVATSAGHMALFAESDQRNGDVYIYDTASGQWSTGQLSQPREGLAATSVGSRALFAGGDGSDVVDIYDAMTGEWSTARLSQARRGLAATSVGSLAFFAGGYSDAGYSDVVDIYDAETGQWITNTLSQPRSQLAATSLGSEVIFAGGLADDGPRGVTRQIDIFDTETRSWSASMLPEPPRIDLVPRERKRGGLPEALAEYVGLAAGDTIRVTWSEHLLGGSLLGFRPVQVQDSVQFVDGTLIEERQPIAVPSDSFMPEQTHTLTLGLDQTLAELGATAYYYNDR